MNSNKPITIVLFVILIVSFLFSFSVEATEEYAERAGAECAECHVDPLGGGELTDFGKGYQLSIIPGRLQEGASTNILSDIIQPLVKYIHIFTAFLWFGTILYVHLILKPSYASQGLPHSEVKVGLASIATMAVTGSILTSYKVPSIHLLVSSRFGIFLLAKISIFAIMVFSAFLVVFVIGPKLKKKIIPKPSKSGEMTLSDLAGFDGKEDRPAYIAFKGKIYNVSESNLWKNGNHMKRHQAGADLTDVLSQAPHNEDKILNMPEVGKLATGESSPSDNVHKRVFFFMAYLNLAFVMIITFILALW
jgi:predicted heme/steroid binding protein/uncharacterized membrane protein